MFSPAFVPRSQSDEADAQYQDHENKDDHDLERHCDNSDQCYQLLKERYQQGNKDQNAPDPSGRFYPHRHNTTPVTAVCSSPTGKTLLNDSTEKVIGFSTRRNAYHA